MIANSDVLYQPLMKIFLEKRINQELRQFDKPKPEAV